MSIFDMIASFIVEKYFVIIGIVIGLSILNDFICIATDAAFYIYDYFTDPLILRQREINNNNNINSRRISSSNDNNNNNLRRVMGDESMGGHASSIRRVNNNNYNYNNRGGSNSNLSNEEDEDTSYYYVPPHLLRQTIQTSGLHNMPRRNVRLVPPEQTRNHCRPPLHRPPLHRNLRSMRLNIASTTTTIAENQEEDNHAINSVVEQVMIVDAPIPILVADELRNVDDFNNNEEGGEEEGDNFFQFILPADFGAAIGSSTNGETGEDGGVSLTYSVSEDGGDSTASSTLVGEDTIIMPSPIMLVSEEVDGEETTTEPVVVPAAAEEEDSNELNGVPLVVEANDEVEGVATTVAAEEEEEEEEEEDAIGCIAIHGDGEGGRETTSASMLGSIWVNHPDYHGCMVRRSSRIMLKSGLRLG